MTCPECGQQGMELSFDGYQTWIGCGNCGFDALYVDGDATEDAE